MTNPLDNVTQAAKALEAAKVALRDAIVQASESGERAVAIAEASGYTRQRVYQLAAEARSDEARMRARLAELDARWDKLIDQASDGEPGDYKRVTAIQNAYSKKLARKGIVQPTVKQMMRDAAETEALSVLEKRRGEPIVEKIVGELDEAATLRQRLTALDETRGFGEIIG